MQDYHRAIVVGSPTFGKSTVQSIFPLDENEKLGFSKITIQKFYGINGTTHQFKGIQPDIILPSIYDDIERGERFLPYALNSDSVEVTLQPLKLKKINTSPLKEKSANRINSNQTFDKVKKLNGKFKSEYLTKETEYALTVENIYKDVEAFQHLLNEFSEVKTEKPDFSVENTSSTKNILIFNKDDKELNEKIVQSIAEDIYIEEAFLIITDLLNN